MHTDIKLYFSTWLVYFYFYCIAGWIFESVYVSVTDKKWTNRGFMKGPWLPLYGSGAVLILTATMRFEQYPAVVYVVGAFTATILEYFTGVAMLKLFKVRYWDYRYRKIQFQGHICLFSTIAWGFLSLLMVYVIHKPVARFIDTWNPEILSVLTFLITVGMVYDFTNALRDALDLRGLLIKAEQLTRQWNDTFEEKKEEWAKKAEEQKKEQLAAIEEAREHLRKKIETKAGHLLLHNPGSSFSGFDKEAQAMRKRLQKRRSAHQTGDVCPEVKGKLFCIRKTGKKK